MMSVRLYFFLDGGRVGWEWLKYKTDSCPPILLESWTHSIHFKASSPQTNQKKQPDLSLLRDLVKTGATRKIRSEARHRLEEKQ